MEDHGIQETFIDGIGNITFIGGVIRADLVSFIPNKTDEKGAPQLLTRQRLILTPQAFLQTVGAFNNIMQKLVDAGVLQSKPIETSKSKEK